MDKSLIVVIDGCAPEYLTRETAPDLFAAAESFGFAKTVKSAIPSVTNVITPAFYPDAFRKKQK